MSLNIVNQDKRRKLYEFGEGKWVCAKLLEVLEESPIGDHYHLKKDECFLLVTGEIIEMTLGNKVATGIKPPFVVDVPRGLYHKFILSPHSILIGLVSEPYDPTDDYHV